MTPYEIECERDRRDQEQSEIATEWYSDGQSDAGLGQLPRWTDEAYLAGYVSRLNQLPKNPDGTIQHYTPRQHFAFGFMDSPTTAPATSSKPLGAAKSCPALRNLWRPSP